MLAATPNEEEHAMAALATVRRLVNARKLKAEIFVDTQSLRSGVDVKYAVGDGRG